MKTFDVAFQEVSQGLVFSGFFFTCGLFDSVLARGLFIPSLSLGNFGLTDFFSFKLGWGVVTLVVPPYKMGS